MSDLVERAEHFATRAHDRIQHRRKYSGQQYDVHLRSVAEIVASVTDDEEMIAAAWLHDVVEDTPATQHDIEAEFGVAVAGLVADLTDVSKPSDGNRASRKSIDREHTARASGRAKSVKLADLIDNCLDITKHDPRFARVFLAEMAATLDVLQDGDAELLARAREIHAECCLELGLEDPPATADFDFEPGALGNPGSMHVSRLFVEAFAAGDIATSLRSFDAGSRSDEALAAMDEQGADVVGVRDAGVVTGYLRRDAVQPGTYLNAARSFSPGQIVDGSAPLSDVVHVLTRYDNCFVRAMGEVVGFITRDGMNDPVVRMWLFGIVTIIEMEWVRRIRANYPDDGWKSLINETRLAKAETLFEERKRRNAGGTLLDCLQLPDKGQILIRDGTMVEWLQFDSNKTAKRAVKDIESLRNHLAHAQDIVAHDWAQIARLASRVEELAGLRGGGHRRDGD
jgi:hypothetical protein